MDKTTFEWDAKKNEANIAKHGVSFFQAQRAFLDPHRIIAKDVKHSMHEIRYYCFGEVDGAIMTVRFTYRNQWIRIFGAGYTERDSKIGIWQGGALNLSQALPAPKQLNLTSLAMQAGHKFSGCPTPPEPIFQSRAVYWREGRKIYEKAQS